MAKLRELHRHTQASSQTWGSGHEEVRKVLCVLKALKAESEELPSGSARVSYLFHLFHFGPFT